jgi:probable HAF family extracellular repeat protein
MRIWKRAGLSFSCVLAFAAITAVAAGKTYNLTTIDVPGAIATNIIGGISDRGDIVGSYTDAAKKTHGFLLSNGVFTTIDVPGATITIARGINARGDVVGTYQFVPSKPGGDLHGFLLKDGILTTFDYPGHLNTIAQRISASGIIVGCYHDADTMGSMHGMQWTAEGFSAIDLPASMNNGPSPEGNRIVGLYTDMMNHGHGYIIDKGAFTSFDVPESNSTAAWDMNPSGEIVGVYADAANHVHGFLRASDEEYLSIDFPAASATRAFGINARGDIVGTYVDAAKQAHGFLAEVARK